MDGLIEHPGVGSEWDGHCYGTGGHVGGVGRGEGFEVRCAADDQAVAGGAGDLKLDLGFV